MKTMTLCLAAAITLSGCSLLGDPASIKIVDSEFQAKGCVLPLPQNSCHILTLEVTNRGSESIGVDGMYWNARLSSGTPDLHTLLDGPDIVRPSSSEKIILGVQTRGGHVTSLGLYDSNGPSDEPQTLTRINVPLPASDVIDATSSATPSASPTASSTTSATPSAAPTPDPEPIVRKHVPYDGPATTSPSGLEASTLRVLETLDVEGSQAATIAFPMEEAGELSWFFVALEGDFSYCFTSEADANATRNDARCWLGDDIGEGAEDAWSLDLDAEWMVLKLWCLDTRCSIHIDLQSQEPTFGTNPAGSQTPLPYVETFDFLENEQRVEVFSMPAAGRIDVDWWNLEPIETAACIVHAVDAQRAANGEPVHCLAEASLRHTFYDNKDNYVTTSLSQNLDAGWYALVFECTDVGTWGDCTSHLELRRSGQADSAPPAPTEATSPNGHTYFQAPIDESFVVDYQERQHFVFHWPGGALQIARDTGEVSEIEYCLFYEYDASRASAAEPFCLDRQELWRKDLTTNHNLDAGWYAFYLECTGTVMVNGAPEPCEARVSIQEA